MERKVGQVYTTNPRTGWVFIFITPQERYFGYITEIKAERLLVVGDMVSFLVAPPRKPGQLSCATDIRLVEGGAE